MAEAGSGLPERIGVPFRRAQMRLGLEDAARDIMTYPEKTLEASIPIRMDDGSFRVFSAWRCQHSTALGPAKGGIRFHPKTNRDEVVALATLLTVKSAALGLPFGGGKGAIRCNPKELSPRELEALSRGYVRAAFDFLGPTKDIPAPEAYTGPEVMAWMADEYYKLRGTKAPGAFTGMPPEMGGFQDRDRTGGKCAALVALLGAKSYGQKPATFTVAGFGHVGFHVAEQLRKLGLRMVAASDLVGAVCRTEGIEPRDLQRYRTISGSITGHPASADLSLAGFYEHPTDILVVCSGEGQVAADDARVTRARLVVEAMDGALSPQAEEIFWDLGTPVVPDILASASGTMASYLEWAESLQGGTLGKEGSLGRLPSIVAQSVKAVHETSMSEKITLREGAFLVGVKRVHEALLLRGFLS